MIPCRSCSRFIRTDALHCPFCDTVVRDASSVLGVAVVGTLLGLGVPACGVGDGFSDTSVAIYGAPPTSAGTTDFGPDTVDSTATDTDTDTDTDTGATSTGADSSTGTGTSTGTDTGTGTGTGTGTDTGTGTGTTSMG